MRHSLCCLALLALSATVLVSWPETVPAVLAQPTDARKAEADRLLQQGQDQYKVSQFQAALESWQQALTLFRTVNDRKGELKALNNIGIIYQAFGQYQQAIAQYKQVLLLARELNYRIGEGRALGNLGIAYVSLGDYSKAIDFYQQHLAIARDISDHKGEGAALGNLGNTYASLGDYVKAIDFHQQYLVITREIGDRSQEGKALSGLGIAYASLGNYAQAIDFYHQELAIAREIGDRTGESRALGNLGIAHQNLEDYVKAIDYYHKSLVIAREIGDHRGQGDSLGNLGNAYVSLGITTQAIDFHQQHLAIAREIGDRTGEGNALNNLGVAYQDLEQPDQARDFYQQGLALFRQIGDRTGEGLALSNLGALLAQQKQPELAIIFYKQSVNLREILRHEQRQQNLSTELQQSYTETVADDYRELADLLLQQDRVLEAQRILDLLKVQELDDYLRGVRSNENTASGMALRQAEQRILVLYEQSQSQLVALGQERVQLSQIPPKQRAPKQQARLKDLRQLETLLRQKLADFFQRPEVQQLVVTLQRSTEGASLEPQHLNDLRNNLAKLAQGAVLLYPLILEDRLELVLVTPQTAPIRRTVKVGRAELNRAIADFRSALDRPSRDAVAPAQQLYDWLIRPLEADLAQAGAKTILYAPDGQLRYIPLAALHDGDQWLVQHFRVNNITAASLDDLDNQPFQGKLSVLAAALTQAREVEVAGTVLKFSALPFAALEVEGLANLIANTETRLDDAFTLDLVNEMDDYPIVHLATHAKFLPGTPEQSFILFGEAPVAIATIADMKNWSFSNVELVVLSACETGVGDQLGDGREILGFGYLMQQAGADATVASLWQVSDGGTQALMNAFYGALQQGMTKTKALRQAQIALITGDYSAVGGQRALVAVVPKEGAAVSQSGLTHPYYWAPFILIGNGL